MGTDNKPNSHPVEGRTGQVVKDGAPSGIDLHPEPPRAVRISRRAGFMIVCIILLLLLGFAWGGIRRALNNQMAARDAGLPKSATPATQAASEFMQATPAGTVPLTLRPPGESASSQAITTPTCGADPQTGQQYRFNPQTGEPCDGFRQERVVVRQPMTTGIRQVAPTQLPQETPEERRIAQAYRQEQEAIQAPTGIRNSGSPGMLSPIGQPAPNDLSQVASSLGHAVSVAGERGDSPSPTNAQVLQNDYDSQNMQSRKEAFLAGSRGRQVDDYLPSGREAPLSRYEIRAGWEIPAVLEQSLNSDLPGELKALVTSNVYDTATGLYLLIPQGSRLIGKYDSRIAYGQDGVQVAWSRIIFPDATALDLDGMLGLDSHGNAGLRDKVDHHYRRIIGFTVLTSLFTAAFDISQRTNQSTLTYPSPAQTAGSAVGQELSETGAQITRRNLNVQPTIKVPAGYKFTVRVNRDILFETPYQPIPAGDRLFDASGQAN